MSAWRGSKRTRSSRAPVSFIDPCLPQRVDRAPAAEGWAHEVKHDGYRLQIHIRAGRVRLFTMTGVDWTERFPRIVESAARIKGSAILDAEGCILGDDGVANFATLHARGHEANVMAYAFDVMMLDDNDLRREPWSKRNKLLFKMLRRSYGGLTYSAADRGRNVLMADDLKSLTPDELVARLEHYVWFRSEGNPPIYEMLRSLRSAPQQDAQRICDDLENTHQVRCEAGPLRNCVEWIELKRRLNLPPSFSPNVRG